MVLASITPSPVGAAVHAGNYRWLRVRSRCAPTIALSSSR